MLKPLQTDTAKASMLRPTARIIASKNSMKKAPVSFSDTKAREEIAPDVKSRHLIPDQKQCFRMLTRSRTTSADYSLFVA